MPASRNARAITFAPRSCPSNPGFAISTRIFFSAILFCRAALPSVDSFASVCARTRILHPIALWVVCRFTAIRFRRLAARFRHHHANHVPLHRMPAQPPARRICLMRKNRPHARLLRRSHVEVFLSVSFKLCHQKLIYLHARKRRLPPDSHLQHAPICCVGDGQSRH